MAMQSLLQTMWDVVEPEAGGHVGHHALLPILGCPRHHRRLDSYEPLVRAQAPAKGAGDDGLWLRKRRQAPNELRKQKQKQPQQQQQYKGKARVITARKQVFALALLCNLSGPLASLVFLVQHTDDIHSYVTW